MKLDGGGNLSLGGTPHHGMQGPRETGMRLRLGDLCKRGAPRRLGHNSFPSTSTLCHRESGQSLGITVPFEGARCPQLFVIQEFLLFLFSHCKFISLLNETHQLVH